jgi:hypothetical protein
MHVVYMIVFQFSDLRPAAFHLPCVLLHAEISILASFVAREPMKGEASTLFASETAPLLAGLLFATGPVHTEVVA